MIESKSSVNGEMKIHSMRMGRTSTTVPLKIFKINKKKIPEKKTQCSIILFSLYSSDFSPFPPLPQTSTAATTIVLEAVFFLIPQKKYIESILFFTGNTEISMEFNMQRTQ